MNKRITGRAAAPSIAAALFSVALAAPANAGTLYRWTDDQGQQHMETIIPANQARLGYEVLDDRNFRIIKRVMRALTDEELAAALEAQLEGAAAKLIQEKIARHDRTLLATYMSVDDMQMARNGQLLTLDSIIASSQSTRERLTSNLDELIAAAAGWERESKRIPKGIQKNIVKIREEIDRQTQIIDENHEKQQQITEQFVADISRFKELKGITDSATTLELGSKVVASSVGQAP